MIGRMGYPDCSLRHPHEWATAANPADEVLVHDAQCSCPGTIVLPNGKKRTKLGQAEQAKQEQRTKQRQEDAKAALAKEEAKQRQEHQSKVIMEKNVLTAITALVKVGTGADAHALSRSTLEKWIRANIDPHCQDKSYSGAIRRLIQTGALVRVSTIPELVVKPASWAVPVPAARRKGISTSSSSSSSAPSCLAGHSHVSA